MKGEGRGLLRCSQKGMEVDEISKKLQKLQNELENWILHSSFLSDGDVAALYSAIEVLIDVRNELAHASAESTR
jgi:hypothetical protein